MSNHEETFQKIKKCIQDITDVIGYPGKLPPTEVFETEVEAFEYASEGLECVDNNRIAYLDDLQGLQEYLVKRRRGCCGFYDVPVEIAGRPGFLGLNYGH
jgi:hypothetical protein